MKKLIFLLGGFWLLPALTWAAADVNFHGTLVEEPCVLAPEDSAIEIEFGNVINKLLYSHQRTPGKAFTLHLLECDLSLGETVRVTFLGTEDILQPGLIALDAISTAQGIALGIESLDNQLVAVNKPSPKSMLKPGANELPFQMFISGEASAIKMKKISPGSISGEVIFSVDYE